MDLLYYLANKPIKEFFCPHCFGWHQGGGETIAEYFKREKLQDSVIPKRTEICCHEKENFTPKGIYFPCRVAHIYKIVFENGIFNLYCMADFMQNRGCITRGDFIGNITLQEIVNNCVRSEIHGNNLDIYFFLNCTKFRSCLECEFHGNEYYMCDEFGGWLEKNELFYHEHSPRPRFTALLGFRYTIEEGDPIFNSEKLRRLYNDIKRRIFELKKRIFTLKRLIDILQRNDLIKNPKDMQDANNIKTELEALTSKMAEFNRKVSELYGESEDNIFSEKSKLRGPNLNPYQILDSPLVMELCEKNLFFQKKSKEYEEQEAGEIITIYRGIQPELANIENKVNQIAEKLRQIQRKQFMEF